jgi:hypothetical protein
VAIHSSGRTIFSFTHIEGIILGAGEVIEQVAGGGSGMGVDGAGEVGDRAREGQAAGVYRTGFTAGSLTRVGARNGMWELGIEVGFDKEFTEVGRMAEHD